MAADGQARTAELVQILVPSTDAYVRLWGPFVFYLDKYWPDRPYALVVGANTKEFSLPGARVVVTRPDLPWGLHFRELLAQVEAEFVLVMMPDYFLTDRTDTASIMRAAELAGDADATSVRLVPSPRPRGARAGQDFVTIEPRALYSTSTVATVWRTRRLMGILQPDDTPWTFERRGHKRREVSEVLFSARRALIHYDPAGALSRGKVTLRWRHRLERDGMGELLGDWPLMTLRQTVGLGVRSVLFNVAMTTSPRLVAWSYDVLEGVEKRVTL